MNNKQHDNKNNNNNSIPTPRHSPHTLRRRRQAKLANIRDGYTSDWEVTPPRDGGGGGASGGKQPRGANKGYPVDGYTSDLEGYRNASYSRTLPRQYTWSPYNNKALEDPYR